MNAYQCVISLKPKTKARHCWVCAIILKDETQRSANPYNIREAGTNCCKRCIESGGLRRRENWLYRIFLDECENADIDNDKVQLLFDSLVRDIMYY